MNKKIFKTNFKIFIFIVFIKMKIILSIINYIIIKSIYTEEAIYILLIYISSTDFFITYL